RTPGKPADDNTTVTRAPATAPPTSVQTLGHIHPHITITVSAPRRATSSIIVTPPMFKWRRALRRLVDFHPMIAIAKPQPGNSHVNFGSLYRTDTGQPSATAIKHRSAPRITCKVHAVSRYLRSSPCLLWMIHT